MRILPLIIVTLTLPILAGCGPLTIGAGRLQVWAVPESVAVHPDTAPELENDVYSESDRRIKLSAAINETVSFQIAMRNDRPSRVTSVRCDDLRSGDQTVPADRVALFREIRVPVEEYPAWYLRLTPGLRRLRWFPDVLVPLTAPRGAMPISLRAGESEAVWVDIRVPAGTPAGKYDSAVHIIPGSGAAVDLALTLEVWSFALPQTGHLPALATIDTAKLLRQHLELHGRPYAPSRLTFDDPAYQRAVNVLDASTRILHEHRCSPILADLQPLHRLSGSGETELDWTDYDRLVAGLIDGTVFDDRTVAPAWPMPVDDKRPSPESYGGWGSPGHEQMLTDYLQQCVGHFAERRWIDRHYVNIAVPGQTLAERYQQYDALGKLLKKADSRLKMVCSVPPESMAVYGWQADGFVDLNELVAIWAPPASLADPEELARQRTAGRQTWLNPDRPPYSGSLSMLAPPVDVQTLAWQAFRFGCDAILLPGVNDWAEDGLPRSTSSEGCLLWPGKPYGIDGPVPSIRLKRLRRGLQDYEYLWLLTRNRRPGIARVVSEDLFPFGGTGCYGEHFLDGRPNGWVADPTAWSLARRLMAGELTSAIEQPAAAPALDEAAEVQRFAQQIDWARLTRVVRNVRVDVEGVRVHGAPDNSEGLGVTATVAVFNATRQAVGGRITAVEAPKGWTQSDTPSEVKDLASARTARRDVPMKASSLEASLEGVIPFKLAFTPENGDAETAIGRLCMLTSQKVVRPLTIDGKLDDWPLGAGNVAGDFVLVGALDVPKQGRGSPDRLSQITTAFVAHDDEYLYIGFACDDDKMAQRRVTRDNQVRYDELWPTGEDLVEVVLDPSGKAIDASELFHVLIKANGAVITQQGVPCLSQVARCEDWPARVTAAVDDQSRPGRWNAEVRIPLASLGPRATFCGVNFGRLIPRLGEYGSWSGARRHLYSPATLGNMYLPK